MPVINKSSVDESHFIVRKRVFPSHLDIQLILAALLEKHSTGQLIIHLGSGGVCSVVFEEKQKITPQ